MPLAKGCIELFLLIVTMCLTLIEADFSISSLTPQQVGFGGGIRLTINGVNFQSSMSLIFSNADGSESFPCTIDFSYADAGQLVCTTTPPLYMSLINSVPTGTTFQMMDTTKLFTVTVGNQVVVMTPNYVVSLTPMLSAFTNSVVRGSVFAFRGRLISRFPRFYSVTFQTTSKSFQCDMLAPLPTDEWVSPEPTAERHLLCSVVDHAEAGYYNVTVTVGIDSIENDNTDTTVQYGRAIPEPGNLFNLWRMNPFGAPYNVEIVPTTYDMYPRTGGISGGVMLTIYGTGFSPTPGNNKVFLGDAPCTVVKSSTNQIICSTTAGSPSQQIVGSGGLIELLYLNVQLVDRTATSYQKKDLQLNDAYRQANPTKTRMWIKELMDWDMLELGTYFQQLSKSTIRSFARILDGYFIPPYTAEYTFYVSGNDLVELWLASAAGPDSAPSLIAWASSSQNDPQRILRYYSSPKSETFYSRKIKLEKGQPYVMQVIHMDYSGDNFFQVACSHPAPSSTTGYKSVPHQMLITVPIGSAMQNFTLSAGINQSVVVQRPQQQADCNTISIAAAIESMSSSYHVSEMVNITQGACLYFLSFARPQGKIELSVDSPDVSMSTYLTGSTDWYYDPIPLGMLRRRAVTLPQNQVGLQVFVNSFAAVENATTAANTISYTMLKDYRPSLTSVDPPAVSVGDKLYLFGSDLVSDPTYIKITVGGVLCSDVAINVDMTRLACTVNNVAPGKQNIVVEVGAYGNPVGPSLSVIVRPTVNFVSPGRGSYFGGTNITLYGSGFPSKTTDVLIRIGGQLCPTVAVSSFYVVCTTPPKPADIIATPSPTPPAQTTNSTNVTLTTAPPTQSPKPTTAPTSWDYEVIVYSGNTSATGVTFVYDFPRSPIITSVSPRLLFGGEITPITITGNNLQAPTSIILCAAACSACVINVATWTPTSLQCIPNPTGEGVHTVEAITVGVGNSNLNLTVTVLYGISDITPNQGSNAGGAELTITGRGFGPRVFPIVGTPSAYSLCTVTSVTNSTIICKLDSNGQKLHALQPVQVFNSVNEFLTNGKRARCLLTACSFLFNDSLTPIVTNVVPKEGQRALVTLTGQNFFGDALIFMGSVPCIVNPDQTKDTQIVCQLRVVGAAGRFLITLDIRPYGFAKFQFSNNDQPYYSFPMALRRISPVEGGVAGGTYLTITGEGFSANPAAYQISIGGSQGGTCTVQNATSTTIICITESLSPKDGVDRNKPTSLYGSVQVTLDSVITATCCQFHYSAEKTPEVETVEPTTGFFGNFVSIAGKNFDPAQGANITLCGMLCLSTTVQTPEKLNCIWGAVVGCIDYIQVRTPIGFAWRGLNVKKFTYAISASVVTPAVSGYFGGRIITVTGTGFQIRPSDIMVAIVCGLSCQVVSSKWDSFTCITPPLITYANMAQYPTVFPTSLIVAFKYIYSDDAEIKTTNQPKNVLDGQFDTYFRANWLGVHLGPHVAGVFREINIFPSSDPVDRANFQGAIVEVAHYNASATWYPLMVLGPLRAGWNKLLVPVIQKDSLITAIKYPQYLRIRGKDQNTILSIAELRLFGLRISNTSDDQCRLFVLATPQGSDPIQTTNNDIIVTYTSALTPMVRQILPRNGTAAGGTAVRLQGSGFGNVQSDVQVTFDGFPCNVNSVSDSEIVCLTTPVGNLDVSKIGTKVQIAGRGSAGIDLVAGFVYADSWSSPLTWLNKVMPKDFDSVLIAKDRSVILDMSPPLLVLLRVEGKLLIDPAKDINLRAYYIIVMNGGMIEAGSRQNPFYSKLKITLYGSSVDPQYDVYGSKMIAVRGSSLSLHGLKPSPIFTRLTETADPGDTSIVVRGAVSWSIGDMIVIAPSGLDYSEAEERVIAGLQYDSKVKNTQISFTLPLLYSHNGGSESLSPQRTIDMGAEVAILTRNIIIEGEEESSKYSKFGAHIMAYSGETQPNAKVRMSNVLLRNVGQQGDTARYPIHFKREGDMGGSFVVECVIQNSFNRGYVLDSVYNVELSDNVAYNIMGHAFATESGTERFVTFQRNLAIMVYATGAAYQHDIQAAGFFFSNPQITVSNNIAAGTSHMGFWLSLPQSPRGVSFTGAICPDRSIMGDFSDNIAHSNGRIGFYVFPQHYPQQLECGSLDFTINPFVPATINGFQTWKNREDGVRLANVAAYVLKQIVVVDSANSGITVGDIVSSATQGVTISQSLICSHSETNFGNVWEAISTRTGVVGVAAPKSEGLYLEDVTFVRFQTGFTDINQLVVPHYAISTCTDCWQDSTKEMGGFTLRVNRLTWISSANRVYLGQPYLDQVIDMDGSAFNLGLNTSLVPALPHMRSLPYCVSTQSVSPAININATIYGGLLCNSSIAFHRVTVFGIKPSSFESAPFVTQSDQGNYLSIFTLSSEKRWSSGYVTWIPSGTGKDYRIFAAGFQDWSQLGLHVSRRNQWKSQYLSVTLNFTQDYIRMDVFPQQEVRVSREMRRTTVIQQDSVPVIRTMYAQSPSVPVTHNYIDLPKKLITLNLLYDTQQDSIFNIQPVACPPTGCIRMASPLVPPTSYNWTDPSAWDAGKVPVDGDEITIRPGRTIFLNTDSAKLNKLIIQGELVFSSIRDVQLRASYIVVYGGKLTIASPDRRSSYTKTAIITLYADASLPPLGIDDTRSVNSGVLAVFGEVNIQGINRPLVWTRLARTAAAGTNQIQLSEAVDWVAGESIVIAATGYYGDQGEQHTIASIQDDRRTITLTKALAYSHIGEDENIGTVQLSIRAQVGLISRNIIIQGAEGSDIGCSLVLGEYSNDANFFAQGIVANVNIRRGGATGKPYGQSATLVIDRVFHKKIDVAKCSISNNFAHALVVNASMNVNFTSNILFGSYGSTILTKGSSSNVFQSNLAMGTSYPKNFVGGSTPYSLCTYDSTDALNFFFDNIAAGSQSEGFCLQIPSCSGTSSTLSGNEAHSNVIGFIPAGTGSCRYASDMRLWRNSYAGLYTALPSNVNLQNIITHDNHIGMILMREGSGYVSVTSSLISGRSSIFASKDRQVPCGELMCIASRLDNSCRERSELYGDAPDMRGAEFGIVMGRFAKFTKKSSYARNDDLLLPFPRTADEPAEYGQVIVSKITFANFVSVADGGFCKGGVAVATSGLNLDRVPTHIFTQVTLIRVSHTAKFYLHRPSDQWTDNSICGNDGCDALNHVIVQDADGSFTGQARPTSVMPQYTVRNLDSCVPVPTWNGYMCPGIVYGELHVTSLDTDSLTRRIGPLQTRSELDLDNIIYSQQPPECYGSCPWSTGKRLGWSNVALETGKIYHIDFNDQPPRRTLYNFDNCVPGIEYRTVIKVRFPEDMDVSLWEAGQALIPASFTGIDEKFQLLPHGTNFFDPLERQLHVVLVCGAPTLEIHQIIKSLIAFQLDMDIADFRSGEADTFAQRFADAVKVTPDRVKVTNLIAGSTIVEVALLADDDVKYNSSSASVEINQIVSALQQTPVQDLNTMLQMTSIIGVAYVTLAEGTPAPPVTITPPTQFPTWMYGVIFGAVGAGLIIVGAVGFWAYKKIMAFQEQVEEDEHSGKEIVFPDFAQPTTNVDRVFDVVKKETGDLRSLKISVANEEEGPEDDVHIFGMAGNVPQGIGEE